MLARLWWKEARTLWPLWAAVLAMAVAVAGLFVRHDRGGVRAGALPPALIALTLLYAFAVGSTAFAGEREGKTLSFLDTLPVGRRALWGGKASFALLSLIALTLTCAGLALAVSALTRQLGPTVAAATPSDLFSLDQPAGWRVGRLIAFLLAALAWSLFWSALRENVLSVAVLAMLSVAAVELAWSALGGVARAELVPPAWALRLAAAGAATIASWTIMTRSPRPGRPPAAPGPCRSRRVKSARADGRGARPSSPWSGRRPARRDRPG